LKGSPLPLTAAEIERRIPLWTALSDLYLDTWMACFVPNVVAAAKDGGFSIDEVDHILRWEVRPALYLNYLNVAGEWAGWPSDWLKDRITATMKKRPPLIIGDGRFMPDEWPAIQAAMDS
jgi:hypothetical protein